jgi:hypothetical protein
MEKQEDITDALGMVSRVALTIATELRDTGDGPEKVAVIQENFAPLLKYLKTWSECTHRPREGGLYDTLFSVFTSAKTSIGLQAVSRKKALAILQKAANLRMPPNSDSRRMARRFFERIGEIAGQRRERAIK